VSVWRDVQEALYERWAEAWKDGDEPASPYCFEDETFDPPEGLWVRFSVKRRPGGAGTIGKPGNRKMDRVGVVFVQLFVPPGDGVGDLSDAAERAAGIFENCRLLTRHDIRFGEVEPGDAFDSDKGRYRAVVVEGRFDYEDIR
jgi:hypothetical protein